MGPRARLAAGIVGLFLLGGALSNAAIGLFAPGRLVGLLPTVGLAALGAVGLLAVALRVGPGRLSELTPFARTAARTVGVVLLLFGAVPIVLGVFIGWAGAVPAALLLLTPGVGLDVLGRRIPSSLSPSAPLGQNPGAAGGSPALPVPATEPSSAPSLEELEKLRIRIRATALDAYESARRRWRELLRIWVIVGVTPTLFSLTFFLLGPGLGPTSVIIGIVVTGVWVLQAAIWWAPLALAERDLARGAIPEDPGAIPGGRLLLRLFRDRRTPATPGPSTGPAGSDLASAMVLIGFGRWMARLTRSAAYALFVLVFILGSLAAYVAVFALAVRFGGGGPLLPRDAGFAWLAALLVAASSFVLLWRRYRQADALELRFARFDASLRSLESAFWGRY